MDVKVYMSFTRSCEDNSLKNDKFVITRSLDIPNLCEFLSSAEHKRRHFEEFWEANNCW